MQNSYNPGSSTNSRFSSPGNEKMTVKYDYSAILLANLQTGKLREREVAKEIKFMTHQKICHTSSIS